LNKLRVLRYLVDQLHVNETAWQAWYRHWAEVGLAAVEERLVADGRSGHHALGDQVGLADIFIVPQIYNARRFNYALERMPTLQRLYDHACALPAIQAARPEVQHDAA